METDCGRGGRPDEEKNMRATAALSAVLLLAGTLRAQEKLKITSPPEGTVVHPGDSVEVLVSASGPALQAMFMSGGADIGIVHQVITRAPYRFSITIPSGIRVGRYFLTAFGFVRPGQEVYSRSLTLDVERSDAPVRLSADSDSFELDVGDRIGLQVTGEYADGSKQDLTESTQIAFVPEAADIVSVSDYGFVTALRPGSTSIIINGLLKIPVTVRPPVRI